jgi:pyrroline-5-carboxylate reductase
MVCPKCVVVGAIAATATAVAVRQVFPDHHPLSRAIPICAGVIATSVSALVVSNAVYYLYNTLFDQDLLLKSCVGESDGLELGDYG